MNTSRFAPLVLATLLALPAAAVAQQPSSAPSFGTLIERLGQRTANDPALTKELNDLVRNQPALMDQIPDLLRNGQVSLETSDSLIFSLEDLGSPEAQRVLSKIQADSGVRSMDRTRAIMSLGAVPEPTPETVADLWMVAARRDMPTNVSLSNVALLSLGIVGGNLRFQGAPGYADIRSGLLGTVATAGNPLERAVALKAVGNLHDPALADEVGAYLSMTSAPVRASAAQALGMLHAESGRDLLAARLVTEPNGAVRAAMADALRALPADDHSLATVLSLVHDERNDEARATMVNYLVEHLKTFDAARQTLAGMTATDPSNRIRLLASAALRG